MTFTLSGVVFEITPTGNAGIEGVSVYCDSCGSPVGHTWATTDAEGFYSFSWSQNGVHPLLVRKAGYEVVNPTRTFPDGTGGTNAVALALPPRVRFWSCEAQTGGTACRLRTCFHSCLATGSPCLRRTPPRR